MRIMCVYTALNNIFIKGRENAGEINAVNLNDSNVR